MLKRIFSSLAIVSLLFTATLSVCWYRSFHTPFDHPDGFTLGKNTNTESEFYGVKGQIFLTVKHKDIWVNDTRGYPFRNAVGETLIVPALWLAVWIRSKLPRPGGREFERRSRLL